MKVAHFADLHLDRPFTWASREVARRRRQALRSTLSRIMEVARERKVGAVLCGGDLFEQSRVSPDTAEFLRMSFETVHPIPVYIAPGNHDWYGPRGLYQRVEWSPNVHIFTEDRLEPVSLGEGLTLWGAAHRVPANTEGFLDSFRVDRAGIHLALFHGSEMGVQEAGKQPHAPFLARDIEPAGIHHAFVGHYHRPRHEERLTYPGNPDPLSFGEDGERGLVLAEIRGDGTVERETVNVAVSDVVDKNVDVTGARSREDIRRKVARALEGRRGVARVTLCGELATEVDLRRGDLQDVADWMDAVVTRVENLRPAYDFEAIAAEATVRGQFVRNVIGSDLPEDERRRVLITGLRALEGRTDLEVL
ncbi:MAG: exonuclease SbcCD subunit D [Acidobacteriota bacterium]